MTDADRDALATRGLTDPLLQRIAVDLIPCGIATVREALDDETSVWINAPRALAVCAWKSQVDALAQADRALRGRTRRLAAARAKLEEGGRCSASG